MIYIYKTNGLFSVFELFKCLSLQQKETVTLTSLELPDAGEDDAIGSANTKNKIIAY